MSSAWLLLTSAEPSRPSLFLDWRAPPECPQREAVLSKIELLRGELGVRALATGAGLIARVQVTQGAGQWRAEIHTHSLGVPGERVVVEASCARAADATALVISLGLA